MRYVNCIVVVCVLFFFIPIAALAGSLNDPGAPTSSTSAMYTLEDIYNRLNAGTAGTTRTGAFTEPSSGPTAGTGHTTDEIMGKAPLVDEMYGAGVGDVASGKTFWGLQSGEWGLKTGTGMITADPAPVAKTGQTTPYATGDDGDLEKGVAWPSSRFTDNGDGTVTDNLTGLIWLKKADYNDTTGAIGPATWANALSFCNALEDGQCGLSDGSSAGAWRLPNVKELQSLIDIAFFNPSLSNNAGTGQWLTPGGTTGSSFTGVQPTYYWSSSTYAGGTSRAWYVGMGYGYVYDDNETYSHYVWPVRGGN